MLRSQGEPLAHSDKMGVSTNQSDQKHEGLYPDLLGSYHGKNQSAVTFFRPSTLLKS